MTRMGHKEMLAEGEQSGCQHPTSALIAKGPTCVARTRNGNSPTGQFGVQVAGVVAPATSSRSVATPNWRLTVGLGAGGSAGTGTRLAQPHRFENE